MATPQPENGVANVEKAFADWFCPLCKEKLAVTPYPKGGGFRLDCYGTDAVPHRLRIYLDKFRKDAPFLLGPRVTGEPHPRKSKLAELQERARKAAA